MNYSKKQKEEIFDVVNRTHLLLKGEKRKATRRQFLSWKINQNSIGAYELFIKLYDSIDIKYSPDEYIKKAEEDNELLQKDLERFKRELKNKQHRLEMNEDRYERELESKDHQLEMNKDRYERELESKDTIIKDLKDDVTAGYLGWSQALLNEMPEDTELLQSDTIIYQAVVHESKIFKYIKQLGNKFKRKEN